jgi:hypothetical protein
VAQVINKHIVTTMLYLFNEKVYFMKGAEKLPEVKLFVSELSEMLARDYLKYLYFTYHKYKSPFITKPLLQRRDFVITHFNLFDYSQNITEGFADLIESNSIFLQLKSVFVEMTYTSLELDSQTYDFKIEQYREKLKNPLNSPKEDIELNDALAVFRKSKFEIEGLIALQNDDGQNDGRHHLFEIPDEHKEQVNGFFA